MRLWKSRAADNPAPERFTAQNLRLGEVALYDLLYVADDGCCGYHHMYVGPQPAPFALCYLYDGKIEWQRPSFSTGIVELLRCYLEGEAEQSRI